jgi:hypothetical protein
LGSGGTGGSRTVGGVNIVPLPQDNAIFDTGSFSAASQTVTADVSRLGKDIDASAVNKSITTFALNNAVTIYGSLNINTTNISFGTGYNFYFEGRGTHTITGTPTSYPVINSAGGTYSLASNIGVGYNIVTFTLSSGTFTAGVYNVTFYNGSAAKFSSTGALTSVLNMGSGSWTFGTSASTTFWTVSGSNYTINGQTSTIVMPSSNATAKTFAGGNAVYNNITLSYTAGSVLFTGNNSFNNFTLSGNAKTVYFTATSTTTIKRITCIGASGQVYTIATNTASSAANINFVNCIPDSDWLVLTDITCTPWWYIGANSTQTRCTRAIACKYNGNF